jgi:hypothetical protein
MRQPTIDRNTCHPFLVGFAVALAPAHFEELRYDDERMMLMAGDIPVIFTDTAVHETTLHTAIRQETTDDR